jgi:predicted anti-sigma-YlaC factor YlaD
MDCQRVRDVLEEYFEGTLPTRRHEAVSAHVAMCESCAAELTQIERMTAALEAAPRVLPSEDLLRSISARLAEMPQPGWKRTVASGWRRLGVVAVALAAVLAVASYLIDLALARSQTLLGSAVIWAKGEIAQLGDWIVAATSLATAVWRAAEDLGGALWLAAKGSAPTLGIYVVAEIGILLAVILVLSHGRRKTLARQTLSV